MIRRLSILGFLSLIVLILLWDFSVKVLFYDPMAGMGVAGETVEAAGIGNAVGYSPAWSDEILSKNLFDRSRGYIPPPEPAQNLEPPPPPPKRPELNLKGIITDRYGEFAILLEKDGQKAVLLRKGDKLDDVEVVDITAKRAVLKWLDEEIDLSMHEQIKTIER